MALRRVIIVRNDSSTTAIAIPILLRVAVLASATIGCASPNEKITMEDALKDVQGEEQQKLDVIANIRFIRALRNGGEVCTIISEEEDEVIQTGNTKGKYIVAIDPLDGSSNIDVNVSIGTIFSIYRRKSETFIRCLKR